MAKIILAVQNGILCVQSHVPGKGFTLVSIASDNAKKLALKFNPETDHDARGLRLQLETLRADRSLSAIRVDDLSRLDTATSRAELGLEPTQYDLANPDNGTVV